MTTKRRSLEHYLRLPYRRRVEVREDSQGAGVYYLAFVEEIPFARIDGESREEALAKLNDVLKDVLEAMLDQGDVPPEPPSWPNSVGVPLAKKLRRRGRKRVGLPAPPEINVERSDDVQYDAGTPDTDTDQAQLLAV